MKRPAKPGEFPDWEKLYKAEEFESLPWYISGIDPDMETALRHTGLTSGDVLDIGTGPGTQAFALAELGFHVTATDLSTSAINKALKTAHRKHIKISFLTDDILRCKLDTQFDIIVDRGCFHVLAPASRPDYVHTAHTLLRSGGYLFLKCFSSKESVMQGGPYRFSPADIKDIFGKRFSIEYINQTVFHGTLNPAAYRAHLRNEKTIDALRAPQDALLRSLFVRRTLKENRIKKRSLSLFYPILPQIVQVVFQLVLVLDLVLGWVHL